MIIFINIYWLLLTFIDLYWYLLILIDIYRSLWIFIDIYRYSLIFIDIYWHLLTFIDIYWYLLTFNDIYWYLSKCIQTRVREVGSSGHSGPNPYKVAKWFDLRAPAPSTVPKRLAVPSWLPRPRPAQHRSNEALSLTYACADCTCKLCIYCNDYFDQCTLYWCLSTFEFIIR